jgi:transmembrane sensor
MASVVEPVEMDDDALAAAAAWRVHLHEIAAVTTEEFETWLLDPEHRDAWDLVSQSWDEIGAVAAMPALIRARQMALEDARRARARGARDGRAWWAVASAAAVIFVALSTWGVVHWMDRPIDYRTAMGERRVITLSDGSRVSLDSNSEVTVHYSKLARELHLISGQARFDVTHDVERPFSVVAGAQKVVATGTAFNINLDGSKVLVTLIEGHVVVFNEKRAAKTLTGRKGDRPHAIELAAGEQLVAVPNAPLQVHPAQIDQAVAWMSGKIVVDNERLSSVVERVNRYTQTPIQIGDQSVGNLRISGVFNTGDVDGFVDTVSHYLPIEAVTRDDGSILLRKRD